MPFTATAENQGLDALANVAPGTNLIAYASLHSAYSATGGNELSGGSPAYARVALSWSAASGGSKSLSSTPAAINVPASSTVAFVGLWSASPGGTFGGMGANGGASFYGFTSTSHTGSPADTLTAPGTAYVNGTAVAVFAGAGGTLPSGLTAGTVYYVVGASGATFQVAATSGGSAINLGTSAASGLVQAVTIETYGAQGTFAISSDTLSFT